MPHHQNLKNLFSAMVSFRKAFNDDYFSNIFMFEVQKNSGYTSKISITHFAARN